MVQRKVQCVIETHSEYLINRIRLRIAEQDEDEDSAIDKDVQILFVEKTDGHTHYREVQINEYGAIANWPVGFFDQSQVESENILEASMNKRISRNTNCPQKAYHALKVLGEVCHQYRGDALDNKDIAAAIRDRLGRKSFASDVSETARNRFSSDYERTYNGEKITSNRLAQHETPGVRFLQRCRGRFETCPYGPWASLPLVRIHWQAG